jgi:hypothetical protein
MNRFGERRPLDKMGRVGLVTTTIYVPTAIHSYIKNAVENGNKVLLSTN